MSNSNNSDNNNTNKRTKIKVDMPDGDSFIVDKKLYLEHRQECMYMYNTINEQIDLKKDDRIDKLMIAFNENLNGVNISILTKRCTLFNIPDVLHKDSDGNLTNYKEMVSKFIDAWSKQPYEESDKEQYEGVFKEIGKHIKFNRIWGNYRFSDTECIDLLEGKHIQFEAITNKGDTKVFIGRLMEQEFNGFKYFGFKTDGWALNEVVFGHKLTQAEKNDLLGGKEVLLTNMISKKGNTFSSYATYNPKTGITFTRRN